MVFFRLILCALIVCFAALPLTAQQVNWYPEKPVSGETITIHLELDEETEPTPKAPQVWYLVWPWYGDAVFHKADMEKQTGAWHAALSTKTEDALISFKIVDTETGFEANNDGNPWNAGFFDENGERTPASWYRLASTYMTGPDAEFARTGAEMFRSVDRSKAAEIHKEAYERHPEDLEIARMYLQSMAQEIRDGGSEEVRNKLRQLGRQIVETWPDKVRAAGSVGHAARIMEMEDLRQEMSDFILSEFYDDPSAEYFRFEALSEMNDDEARPRAAEAYLRDFPQSQRATFVFNEMLLKPVLEEGGDVGELLDFLDEHGITQPQIWNFAARQVTSKHLDEFEDTGRRPADSNALELYHLALEKVDEHVSRMEYPPYLTPRDIENHRQMRDQVLGSGDGGPAFANALLLDGQIERSVEVMTEYYEITEQKSGFLYDRVIRLLYLAGEHDIAKKKAETAVLNNTYSDDVMEYYRKSWTAVHGSDEGFEQRLDELRLETTAHVQEAMAERMMSEPMPEFELPGLNDLHVRSEDLEGKVVVIDFWATWCGPCVYSFPLLQQVVDYYEENDDVVILAVNAWEGEYGEERIQKAADFMDEHELDFHVLFDTDDSLIAEFGVRGIPTRFTIGRDGNIRFEDIGFSGPGMVTDMKVQIEMLLEEEYALVD